VAGTVQSVACSRCNRGRCKGQAPAKDWGGDVQLLLVAAGIWVEIAVHGSSCWRCRRQAQAVLNGHSTALLMLQSLRSARIVIAAQLLVSNFYMVLHMARRQQHASGALPSVKATCFHPLPSKSLQCVCVCVLHDACCVPAGLPRWRALTTLTSLWKQPAWPV
jgi:hypothetical protein